MDKEARLVRETGVAGEIAALAEPVLEELGFRLVRVVVSGRDGGTVQIMAEDANGALTVDQCAQISRRLSPVLDVADPMPGRYRLEISSPGIDRPLVRARDFETWAGHEAKIELSEAVEGQRRFRGRIEGFEDGELRLETQLPGFDAPRVLGFPLEMIAAAKLVMTDELIRTALAHQGSRADAGAAAQLRASAETDSNSER